MHENLKGNVNKGLKNHYKNREQSMLPNIGSNKIVISRKSESKIKVKKTTAKTDQTMSKAVGIKYFDWPIPVFIRFIRKNHEYTEYNYTVIK